MILQRYTFGSKSQLSTKVGRGKFCCLWYCKDIHLEANHNHSCEVLFINVLFMILQRYTFGSKSQRLLNYMIVVLCCLWYCKDIHLEANHNCLTGIYIYMNVVYDIAKIYIWKQITTEDNNIFFSFLLFMILQRYTFGSKSQLSGINLSYLMSCLWYCKDIHLEANHNYVANI